MFAWLKNKKLKPTAEVASAARGSRNGWVLPRTNAAGTDADSLATDPLPPHPLLSLLPAGTLERLLAGGAVADYKKGTVIYHAGEPCEAIYLILSGRCESRQSAVNGADEIGEVFGPGDLLGARALLNREPHRCTTTVVTHALLLRIPADELTGLFASDPSVAGHFSQTVTAAAETAAPRGPRVRRIVTLLPLGHRIDAAAVVHRLGGVLSQITGQKVLLVRVGSESGADGISFPLNTPTNGAEFSFTRQLRTGDGFEEIRVTAGADSRDVTAVAKLLSHCGRHYDYVLLYLTPETPAGVTVASLIESDLGFVLLQPDMQNLYDFQLLMREIAARSPASSAQVKPILFAEESLAAPEADTALKGIGHPVHSIVRGFPLSRQAVTPDRRFDLAINRLAREIGRCRVGLALSSGSAKGLAHIGVIQVLEENDIEIDCIAGSSMGAYVGAHWAFGLDGDQLEKVARETEGRWGYLRLLDPMILPRRGFLRTRRAAARLKRRIDNANFSDLMRPLRVVATHLDTLERVVFSGGAVAPAVEASIAIPGVCVPVTIDGETYIDGGIADPLPVDVLEEMGIEKIIAVNVIPPPERIRYWLDARRELNGRERPKRGLARFVNRHFNYGASGNIIDTMMRAINGAQTRVAEASARQADLVLRPISGEAVWHDFSQPRKQITLGRDVAEAQLPELKALTRTNPNDPEPSLALRSTLAA
jgi:NTE family protein